MQHKEGICEVSGRSGEFSAFNAEFLSLLQLSDYHHLKCRNNLNKWSKRSWCYNGCSSMLFCGGNCFRKITKKLAQVCKLVQFIIMFPTDAI